MKNEIEHDQQLFTKYIHKLSMLRVSVLIVCSQQPHCPGWYRYDDGWRSEPNGLQYAGIYEGDDMLMMNDEDDDMLMMDADDNDMLMME